MVSSLRLTSGLKDMINSDGGKPVLRNLKKLFPWWMSWRAKKTASAAATTEKTHFSRRKEDPLRTISAPFSRIISIPAFAVPANGRDRTASFENCPAHQSDRAT